MGRQVSRCSIFVTVTAGIGFLCCVSWLTYKYSSGSSGQDETEAESDGLRAISPLKECHGPQWECNVRLDSNVLPAHYDLFLYPDFHTGLFTGHVTIKLNVTVPVDHLRLHTKSLSISKTELVHGAHHKIKIKETFEWSKNQFWVVRPTDKLGVGNYSVRMEFNGSLTSGIVGFYRSKYFDKAANASKYVVSSKFQPTYARRAFPCFDEPTFKSSFAVSLVKPSELTALSNMPLEREVHNEPKPGLTTVYFEKSVPMVTYLVVFAIGDFDYRHRTTSRGIPVRVYATKFQVSNGLADFAVNKTVGIVDYFEDYFGINYPLPKLDIIGIPDFVSGAMEHWGLISFREANLLYQRGVGSAYNKQRVVSVIAHELAHMWFGNLVTLKWWSDLWLNEGFASYMEYKGVEYEHESWDMQNQFASDDLTRVLHLDGQHSSHPIVQTVSHPDQITELFDTISYSKGATVIRMLENFMGKDNFRERVTTFLKKYSFKNAQTKDLWETLQNGTSPHTINITLVMDTWTTQMGYPVLTPIIDPDSTKLTIHQQRFLEDRLSKKPVSESTASPFNYKWEIPLQIQPSSFAKPGSPGKLVWLPHTQNSISIDVEPGEKWVKLNAGQYGYFRVNYSVPMWTAIKDNILGTKDMSGSVFSPRERCGLIDDAFSLAFANYIPYDVALDFARVLENELHFVPWDCAYTHLRRISRLLSESDPNAYAIYRKYILELISTAYSKFGWGDSEQDEHLNRLLKPRIFNLACEAGYPGCLLKTKSLLDDWIGTSKIPVPSGLRDLVYKWGILQSDERTWDKVWERYLVESDPQEKVRLLKGLGGTQETWLLRRLLNMAKNESLIPRQDFFNVIKYVGSHPIGNSIAWSFFQNEYDYLLQRFGLNDRYFGRLVHDLSADFASQVNLREMYSLFKKYPDAGAGARARLSAVENVQNNIRWRNRNADVIHWWLSSQTFIRVPAHLLR